MTRIKFVAHDATNHEIGSPDDVCIDIWDDSVPGQPHPVVRVYFCGGEHDREKLINHILAYKEEIEVSR